MAFTGSVRFRLHDKLGEGGAGIVYDAYDQARDMRVALKTLRHVDALGLYRFKREFRALSDLSHPNIINLYELVSEGDEWFLTMELIAGRDFITHVRHRDDSHPHPHPFPKLADASNTEDTRTAHGLSHTASIATITSHHLFVRGTSAGASSGLPTPPAAPRDAAELVDLGRLRDGIRQLARALYALHSVGIVHRDLKPSNVYVTEEGRVVLMDFGIVAEMSGPYDPRASTEPGWTRPASGAVRHAIVGTPSFMAPEQTSGAAPSPAADWYALGVMLYLSLSQRLPFEGSPRQMMAAKKELDPLPLDRFVRGAPTDLVALCHNLLARDAAKRATGAEILAALGIASSEAAPAITMSPVTHSDIFIGRQAALDSLHEAYAAVRDGQSRCVWVSGASGMGKTTLIERFVRQIAADDPTLTTLSGRCHDGESLAYKAFDGVVDDLSNYLIELADDEREAALPRGVGAITRLFPTASRIPGCDPGNLLNGRDPLELRRQAFEALRALLVGLAGGQPLVIRIEDVQWADRDSLELLSYLMAEPAPPGLLVLVTACFPEDMGQRRNVIDSGTFRSFTLTEGESTASRAIALSTMLVAELGRQGILCWLELGPLEGYEQRALVVELGRQSAALGALDEDAWREIGGHPMLLGELARYAQQAPDDIAEVRGLDLKEVIWRRILDLSSVPASLLHVLAIAAEPTPLKVLAQAAGLSDNHRERAWSILRIARLARRIRRLERQLWVDSFHSKVRETILEHLPRDQIKALHGAVAHALEDWGRASPARLARHWLAAGDTRNGVRWLVRAARHASEQLATERATELFGVALAFMDDELDPDEPDADGVDPGVLDPDTAELVTLRCQALLGLAEGMRQVGAVEQALESLDRAEELAARQGLFEELTAVHMMRGSLFFASGNVQGCLIQHEKAHHSALETGSREDEIRALGGIGDAYLASGRTRAAFEKYDACVALSRELEFAALECAHLGPRGWMRLYSLEIAEAVRDCRDGAALASRCGHRRAEAIAHSCLGIVLSERGPFDEARYELAVCVEQMQGLGMQRFERIHLALLARILKVMGEDEQALAMARSTWSGSNQGDRAFAGPLMLGSIAFVTSDRDEFSRALEQGESLLAAGSPGFNYLFFLRDAIIASYRWSDVERVARYTRRLQRFATQDPVPWSQFFVDLGHALAARLGEPDADAADAADADGPRAALRRLQARAAEAGLASANAVLHEALA